MERFIRIGTGRAKFAYILTTLVVIGAVALVACGGGTGQIDTTGTPPHATIAVTPVPSAPDISRALQWGSSMDWSGTGSAALSRPRSRGNLMIFDLTIAPRVSSFDGSAMVGCCSAADTAGATYGCEAAGPTSIAAGGEGVFELVCGPLGPSAILQTVKFSVWALGQRPLETTFDHVHFSLADIPRE